MKHLTSKFSETDVIKMPEILIDNIFVILFGGRVFQQSRHSRWYKLFSPSRRLHSLFVRGRLHTGASKEKQKIASPML
jgi:hypothetical protein